MKQNTRNDSNLCPVHGRELSSLDGMYDAPCSACEADGAQAEDDARWNALSQQERDAINSRITRNEQERVAHDEALANDQPF